MQNLTRQTNQLPAPLHASTPRRGPDSTEKPSRQPYSSLANRRLLHIVVATSLFRPLHGFSLQRGQHTYPTNPIEHPTKCALSDT